jgi:4-hydroxybenzoyl-CoA thioesterase
MAFEHEIRVTWGDCDPAKIVYTPRLPGFALDAINAWREHHVGGGWYQLELDQNIGMPFVSMQMNFKAPVTPRHRLICKVWPNSLGTSSLGFTVEGWQNGQLCFDGDFVSVFVDPTAFKKTVPPDHLRKIVEEQMIPKA